MSVQGHSRLKYSGRVARPSASRKITPRRSPGRPAASADSVERRRRELIEAAYAEFAERGYRATTVADITRRANVASGTFYRYFENKRAIVDDVLDFGVQRAVSFLTGESPPSAVRSAEELADQLRRIHVRLFEILEAEPALARLILFEIAAIDNETRERALSVSAVLVSFVSAYVEHGVAQGFLRPDLDPVILAEATVALGLPALVATQRGPLSAERKQQYAEMCTRLLLDGARARTSPNAADPAEQDQSGMR